jgi:hypothetical protein
MAEQGQNAQLKVVVQVRKTLPLPEFAALDQIPPQDHRTIVGPGDRRGRQQARLEQHQQGVEGHLPTQRRRLAVDDGVGGQAFGVEQARRTLGPEVGRRG